MAASKSTVSALPAVLPSFTALATGVSMSTLPDGRIMLLIDRTGPGVASSTGKTVLKANTHGFMAVPGFAGEKCNVIWTAEK